MSFFGMETPLIIIAILLFMGYIIFRILFSFFLETQVGKKFALRFLLKDIDKVYLPSLRHFFPFYNALSDQNKVYFERRVQEFIRLKEFIPRGGISDVTPEMKTLIAGSAIQLTFGYPAIYFRHFKRILIYPNDYYSTITRKYHKGEVNRRGIIVVSLSSLKEGFVDSADGHHLGLHEMAHALRLINIVNNDEYDFYDRKTMEAFDRKAHIEIKKMLQGEKRASFFRDYSSTNLEEFFAVAVEAFFECSGEFREYSPELYHLLSKILKIDPIVVYQTGEVHQKRN
jgi:Mlc titration factor MtfA (ptsG expression regulator)